MVKLFLHSLVLSSCLSCSLPYATLCTYRGTKDTQLKLTVLKNISHFCQKQYNYIAILLQQYNPVP